VRRTGGSSAASSKVLIPDNLKAVVLTADAVTPGCRRAGWTMRSPSGFATDPARIRSPQDKPRVERRCSASAATSGPGSP
jgi:hypothetical protein